LHSSEEYLIQLKGTIDAINGIEAVTSLTFITNQRICGPYGSTSGRAFESSPGKVVGFFGRFESILHQIGVITELSSEIQSRRSFGRTIVVSRNGTDVEEHILDGGIQAAQGKFVVHGEGSNTHRDSVQKIEHWYSGIAGSKEVVGRPLEETTYDTSKTTYDTKYLVSPDVLVIQQGPWGGSSGQEFYDGRGDIVDLNISYNKSLITSIQVGYEQGGTNFQAPLHGGVGAEHIKVCNEFLLYHLIHSKHYVVGFRV